jgi:hypothetical protein
VRGRREIARSSERLVAVITCSASRTFASLVLLIGPDCIRMPAALFPERLQMSKGV